MINKRSIRKVDAYTDWCSNVCFVIICNLDSQKLNANLKSCPLKIPTVEEMNPTFANAKYISKLDAKAGYWSVKLDEKPSCLPRSAFS